MTVPFRFREAGLDDNERLIELTRRCIAKGQFRVYSDRHPDFFAMPRLQGERSHIWVAESLDGDIVASVVFVERTVRMGDQDVKVLHFGDLRTDPRLSRSRLAGRFFFEIYSELLQSGPYHHGMSALFSGNTALRALHRSGQKYFGPNIQLREEGLVQMYQLLPIWNYRNIKGYQYRPAREEELPRLASLLRDTYAESVGAPQFSVEWLANATQQHASFGVDKIWVAEDNQGEIAACVAVWDQTAFRRTVALRFSRGLKFLLRFFALLGFVWRLPPVPEEGRPLRIAYLRWPAARDPRALNGLLRFLMRQVRTEGKHQSVAIAFHESDRLRSALSGIFRFRTQVHLYTHRMKTKNDTAALALTTQSGVPHYIDLALI